MCVQMLELGASCPADLLDVEQVSRYTHTPCALTARTDGALSPAWWYSCWVVLILGPQLSSHSMAGCVATAVDLCYAMLPW